jgi:hypothetical protein
MGRWCYFNNGFEYKFWFGRQNSGFLFFADKGVKCDEQREYDIPSFFENDGEHHFCDANCDKEIKPIHEMLLINNLLFCDAECQANFTGDADEVKDLDGEAWKKAMEVKYRLVQWASTQEDHVYEDDLPEKAFTLFLQPGDNVMFQLTVNRYELLAHLQTCGFQLPDFDSYNQEIDGINDMYDDVLKQWNDQGDEEVERYASSKRANFCLGCILYHMSGYEEDLTGMYELC